jgi:hypothetical protein
VCILSGEGDIAIVATEFNIKPSRKHENGANRHGSPLVERDSSVRMEDVRQEGRWPSAASVTSGWIWRLTSSVQVTESDMIRKTMSSDDEP